MNWLNIQLQFILHQPCALNTGNKKMINFSCHASLFPVLCLQNCWHFSSASFVHAQLSFFAYQILATVSFVSSVEEMILYGTIILSPSRPAFHPNPVCVWFTIIEVELDQHHVFGWNIVVFQTFIVSCFGQWRMSLHV